MGIEYKVFQAEVKKFDDENLIVEHFISTEHKDRGGDIMRAKGMKIVGKPVVLLLHGRGSMGSEPIGKPLAITVDEFKGQPGVLAKTQFFNDEVGQRLYRKVKEGFLPNWSIGYAVDEAKDLMEAGRYAGRDVTKWQLLEYSPVGVPMNPFAQTVKEFLDKVDAGEDPPKEEGHWFGIAEEPETPAAAAPPPIEDPAKAFDDRLTALESSINALIEQVKALTPAPPAAPEPGTKAGEEPPSNPPEAEPPVPVLVFHDGRKESQERDDAARKERDRAVIMAREVLQAAAQAQADRILGRVH